MPHAPYCYVPEEPYPFQQCSELKTKSVYFNAEDEIETPQNIYSSFYEEESSESSYVSNYNPYEDS
ncbi:hypothetical protein TVAG_369160 [Trichomonas vaginalis G3]|uniref:Uncharacterized protein n=1 Tax=Trichomonas vaginalis (strain ATCC PRA-98 / G3) TaxID=412133 RepID=A2FGE2_TRIV3|nr:uncharacterized protein TVAGG3_1065480 [Trichomonas vaginalis G3]EAX96006.1 hypothetical protein TVAG_369160 [Trichomonas vaginalis G3]KAI5483329.1 hypothetical protein TVAGG3_1065480 [Trichomonas vaginalis G3]|eukprot:XP_001308936.1 hypothetical protein [Trichomonas vaginalis G3]